MKEERGSSHNPPPYIHPLKRWMGSGEHFNFTLPRHQMTSSNDDIKCCFK